jgi:two-component system phosphate regulon response regulator PhoB
VCLNRALKLNCPPTFKVPVNVVRMRGGIAVTTILVADDDSDIRDILRMRLVRELGCRVVEAANGEQALSLATRELPDAVILDWSMPGLTGIEVLTALRRQEATTRIPVIMMTAREDHTAESQARSLGTVAYVPKPVDFARLKRAIHEALSQHPNDGLPCREERK